MVVAARLAYPRVAGMPLETRGVLAAPDPIGGGLTVWTSTQVPFAVRSAIAPVVGLAEERIRVLVPDVGGGFGVKGHVYPEEILVAVVARRLGRPVKWAETRSEHCLTAAGDRDQVHEARIGLERDGRIIAIETAFTRDHGAAPTLGEAITLNTINHLPGPYRVPHYRGTGQNVLTHKTFAAAYRGAGRPEAAFVLDRLLDRAAREIGMDPAALRRLNLIRPDEMPFPTGLTYRDGAPIVYDPADYPAAFDRLLAPLDYPGWRARQAERRGGPRPIGIGLCAYVEGTGIGPFEGADIRVDPDGTVFVHLGVCAQGQGHETTLAQIAADELGVALESVAVVGGDTSLVGYGMGTIASRVAAVGGPAVQRSAAQVAHKARLVGAEMFECAPEDVVLAEGRVGVRGVPGKSVSLGQVARAAVRSRAVAEAGGPGLSACAFFYPDTVTWAFGVQGIVLEVDLEACAITLLRLAAMHDCGRPDQPGDRGGPAPRRDRPGPGQRARRGADLRRRGPAADRHPDGLPDAPRRRHAAARRGAHELPVRDQSPGHQGRGRERRHLAGRRGGQRSGGCARRLRRPGGPAAGHLGPRVRAAARDRPLAREPLRLS